LRNSVLCLVLGVGLLAGTLIAHAQTPRPTLVAQAPVTVPPSGVLMTQPPAPVAVPPSGALVTQPNPEGHTVAIAPVKPTQQVRTAETAAPTTLRHVAHRRTAAHRATTRTLARQDVARRVTTTRTTTVRESIVSASAVATTAAAAPLYIVPRYYNFVAPSAARALTSRPVTARGAAPMVSTAAPVVATTPMPTYRYVYEPDRILVIEPSSNIAVQAIPR
jgi:hypothetical protein